MRRALVVTMIGLATAAAPAHAATSDIGLAMAVAGDGTALVGDATTLPGGETNTALALFDPSGALVTSFGANGKTTLGLPGVDAATSAAWDGDTAVVAGVYGTDVLLAQVERSGAANARSIDLGGSDRADAVVITPTGPVVAAESDGAAFAFRVSDDGTAGLLVPLTSPGVAIDRVTAATYDPFRDVVHFAGNTTGNDGAIVTLDAATLAPVTGSPIVVDHGTSGDTVNAVAALPDRVVGVGGTGGTVKLTEHDASGAQIGTSHTFDWGFPVELPFDLAIHPNGDRVFAGQVGFGTSADAAIGMVDSSYMPVNTFSGDGKLVFDGPGAGGPNFMDEVAALPAGVTLSTGGAANGSAADDFDVRAFDATGGQLPGYGFLDFTDEEVALAIGQGTTSSTPGGAQTQTDKRADLVIGKALIPLGTKFAAVGERLFYQVVVPNRGPDAAENVSIVDTVPPGLEIVRLITSGNDSVFLTDDDLPDAVLDSYIDFPADATCAIVDGRAAAGCRVPRLPAQGVVAFVVEVRAKSVGTWSNRLTATSDATDPNPADNDRETDKLFITERPATTVRLLPDGAEGRGATREVPGPRGGDSTQIMRPVSPAGDERTLERLGRLARVEVAVLRKQGNKRRCLWLVNKRLKFKASRARKGKCDRGRWLRAKGTRRWRYKLARKWPKGTYTLYSRAVNRAGVRETRFSKRDKNSLTFTIRR